MESATSTQPRHVAIVGTGLVGLGWAIVFSRAGWIVRLFDKQPGASEKARSIAGERLKDLLEAKLIDDVASVLERISVSDSLESAIEGADYVQESVFERVDVKRAIYDELERRIGSSAIVGSSSSGIPASQFADQPTFRERCLVVHPVNPPYLIPLVELVPSPWTSEDTVAAAHSIMLGVGQTPIRLACEIEGFVLNRLQGAILREAWRLYEEGIASLKDIDLAVSAGLGKRWSFMGPFETIDLNAPGGIAVYARRLGPLYARIAGEPDKPWPEDLIDRVEADRRAQQPASTLDARARWRDRQLMARLTNT